MRINLGVGLEPDQMASLAIGASLSKVDEYTPRLVQALVGRKVVQVDAGWYTIVSTEDGEVYTMPYGASDGSLGRGDSPGEWLSPARHVSTSIGGSGR